MIVLLVYVLNVMKINRINGSALENDIKAWT